MILYINIFALIVFTTYIIYVRLVLGYFSKSLSQSFYDIQEKTGNMNLLFLFMLAISSGTLVINGYNCVGLDNGVPILAFGGLGIFTVGVFAIFKNKKVSIFHYLSAGLGFAISIIGLYIDCGLIWQPITIGLLSIIGFISSPENIRIFVLEIILGFGLIISLL